MATWGTEIQKAGNGIATFFGNAGDKIQSLFAGTVKKAVADVSTYFSNGGTTVVGINVNKIPSMQEAVRSYVSEINTALDELNNYDPEVAFKGSEVVPALKDYIAAVKEACGAICSNLLAFNDKLEDVKKAYEAKDAAASSQIKSTANSTREAYDVYTEKGTVA